MESLKTNFIIFVFIFGVVALGIWAFKSINSANDSIIEGYESIDIGPVVTTEPEDSYVPPQNTTPETPVVDPAPQAPTPNPVEPNEVPTPTTPVGENAQLIKDIQKLITDKILMKKGSRGTRVGTVQKFLNEYGIKVDVDNDYGDTTVNAVKKFQQEQGLLADGQAGEGTYKKMIEWLEKN